MTSKRFQRLLDEARKKDDYWVHDAIHEFTEGLYALMLRRDVSKSELARRIDSSPAYITKVMRGNTNFTLASMVRLVRALGGQLKVKVCADEDWAQWVHVKSHRPARPMVQRQAFRQIDLTRNDGRYEQEQHDERLTATA
jgi:plasmid maintenance system antidote protein VapI